MPKRRVNFVPRFNMIRNSLALFAGIMLLFSTVSFAENSHVPIHIEADRMVSQEQDNAVIFMGNVDARQGGLMIRTDKMTVNYVQEGDGLDTKGVSEVKKLICTGNVQISQGDWLGTGRRMDYYALERKVVLSGGAKAWQGQNMIAGKTITYFLDEGRSIVEGPVTADSKAAKGKGKKSGRVKAVIHPDGDKK